VIFIDEIDSLLSARSEGEQESSRRVKTEFLIELDGAKTSNNERVLIIGATNLPKELDDAVRRRFVKRLYIPLPNAEGRIQLIKSLTTNSAFYLKEEDLKVLALKTRGFSGADMYNLCSEASMIPLREMSSIEDVR
jgi:SpoVK/Ycf46/Vps4 family AAA+-type ATPase